jgi:hypothetical protein
MRLCEWGGYMAPAEIDAEGFMGLSFTGPAGTGKSTIVDALLWALTGNQVKVRFNAAAGSTSANKRNLQSYCRWYNGAYFVRKEGISHVLLEFTHAETAEQITVGSVIEYKENETKPVFVVGDIPLTPDLVMRSRGQGNWLRYTLSDLKNRRTDWADQGWNVDFIDEPGAYQRQLMMRFGDMREHFFDLLNRTAAADPTSLDAFIRNTLFNDEPIDLTNLDGVVQEYRTAHNELVAAEKKLNAVREVVTRYGQFKTVENEQARLSMCRARMRRARMEDRLTQVVTAKEQQIAAQESLARNIQELEEASIRVQQEQQEAIRAEQSSGDAREKQDQEQRESGLLRQAERLQARVDELDQTETALRCWLKSAIQDLPRLFAEIGIEVVLPISEMQSQVDAPTLMPEKILDWVQTLTGLIGSTLADLRKNESSAKRIATDLQRDLEAGGHGYAPQVLRAIEMRKRLSERFGEVPLLYETIMTVDADWQPVIETLLGVRRWAMVPPEHRATEFITEFKRLMAERTTDRFVAIDVASIAHVSATPIPGRLSALAQTTHPYVRKLLNQALNHYAPHPNDDLPLPEHGVTFVNRQGLSRGGGTYQVSYVLRPADCLFGEGARQAREADLKLRQDTIRQELQNIQHWINQIAGWLDRTRPLLGQAGKIDLSVRDELAQTQDNLRVVQARLAILKASPSIAELRERVETAHRQFSTIYQQLGQAKEQQRYLAIQIESTQNEIAEIQKRLSAAPALPVLTTEDDALFTQMCSADTWEERDEQVQSELKRSEERFAKAEREFNDWADSYFATHRQQFSPSDTHEKGRTCEEEYQVLSRSLEEQDTEGKVRRLRRAAEDSLFMVFINTLYAEFSRIRSTITAVNQVIDKVTFVDRTYRIISTESPLPLVKAVLDLVRDGNATATGTKQITGETKFAGISDQVRTTYADLIDRLFEILVTNDGKTSGEKAVLVTPTQYYQFDMRVREGDREFHLGPGFTGGSGGQRQLPVYVILSAAMLSIYKEGTGLHPRRLRLIILDEAFGKAPANAEEGLGMIVAMGLQPIVSAPTLLAPVVEKVLCNTRIVHKLKQANEARIIVAKATDEYRQAARQVRAERMREMFYA